MDIALRFLLSVLIIAGLLLIIPGIKTSKIYCAFFAAAVITLINMFISPLFNVSSVPVTALTFGLIIVFLDALLLWFLGLVLKGISVDGFGWAFVFSVVLSLIIYIIELVFNPGYFEIFG